MKKSLENTGEKKKSEYRAQFVFVVLNGVPLEGGPHALDKGRRGEVEGIRGGRRRGADKAAWSIRSAPIVDHFEGSVFERNPRKWSFFSRGFCRASHNCDLRGTGAAAAR